MNRSYDVRIDPIAYEALTDTALYIENDAGPSRARRWLARLLSSIEDLAASPRAHAPVCMRLGRQIRSKLSLNHRIFFFVDESRRLVYVIDIVHTARDSRLADYRDPGS